MLDLLLFLVKLPFILIRVATAVLQGLTGILAAVGAGLAGSGLWAVFLCAVATFVVVWLLLKLLRRAEAETAQL